MFKYLKLDSFATKTFLHLVVMTYLIVGVLLFFSNRGFDLKLILYTTIYLILAYFIFCYVHYALSKESSEELKKRTKKFH